MSAQTDFGFGEALPERDWSRYQEGIFSFIERGTGNGRIDAVAGSGKTTTAVEGMRRTMLGRNIIAVAFNKGIETELTRRGVPARTFHSLCLGTLKRELPACQLEDKPDKLWRLIRDNWGRNERRIYDDWCYRLVGLAKNHGIGAIVRDEDERWIELIEHFDLDFSPGADGFDPERALELSRELLADSNADETRIDFTDMLYLTLRKDLRLPTYDAVYVDEAQDTNPIQREVVRRILRGNSRLFAIGDPNQAIYGFRGASADAMDLLSEDFGCTTLPLSICYRCGSSIVEHAQQWVPHIEAAPGAHEGRVEVLGDRWDVSDFKPGDFVICRINAPLFGLAMKLLRLRIPVHIHGREISVGLKAAIKRTGANDIETMLVRLQEATTKEMEKAKRKDQPLRAQAAWDRLMAINHMSDSCGTVTELLGVIDELFRDKSNAVQISTIHKVKGQESDTVWWLKPQMPWISRLTGWQADQEVNLNYVAATRAKNRLAIIEPHMGE